MSKMTSTATVERVDEDAETSGVAWGRVELSLMPILFRWGRSEKEDSDGGDGIKIGTILKARGRSSLKLLPTCGSTRKVRWGWFQRRWVDQFKIYRRYFWCHNRRAQWIVPQGSGLWRWRFNLEDLRQWRSNRERTQKAYWLENLRQQRIPTKKDCKT